MEPFKISDELYSAWDCRIKGAELENVWQQQFAEYAGKYPDLAAEYERQASGSLPENWEETLQPLINELANQEISLP